MALSPDSRFRLVICYYFLFGLSTVSVNYFFISLLVFDFLSVLLGAGILIYTPTLSYLAYAIS